jgi:hypothetical protein
VSELCLMFVFFVEKLLNSLENEEEGYYNQFMEGNRHKVVTSESRISHSSVKISEWLIYFRLLFLLLSM